MFILGFLQSETIPKTLLAGKQKNAGINREWDINLISLLL